MVIELFTAMIVNWRLNMSKYKIDVDIFDGLEYLHVDFGYESHGKISFRLWIDPSFVQSTNSDPHIIFPLPGKIHRTENGHLVLLPDENMFVYDIFVSCGYRGNSYVSPESPHFGEFPYYIYNSPLGSTGISEGKLVNYPKELRWSWEKTGRTYGNPCNGEIVISPNGDLKMNYEE